MANHPSRGWRRRARLVADQHAALLMEGRRDDAVVIMQGVDVRTLLTDSFRAGFEAGRLDVLEPRRGDRHVHVGG